jgi:hypothetical protein
LSKIIFKLLKKILLDEYADVVPYGLDTDGTWELSGINKCIRLNCYAAPSVGFKPHYDAAFCESNTIKSALSIVAYLNGYQEGVRGGNTIFYDKANKIDAQGLTVKEEIAINSGLDTYEKIVIEPDIGKCIIFKQDTLHGASEVTGGTKYILRADVVYRKVTVNKTLTIFDDFKYQKAVNYFKEAQIKRIRKPIIVFQ